MSNARDIALRALRDRQGNISAHLDRLLNETDLSAADRGLARELTLGVVRRTSTLNHVMRAYLVKPNAKLPRAVRNIIHLAIYQILFLDRVPDFAVVDQAVRQCQHGHKRQAGMVNGLLRTLLRELDDTLAPFEGPSPDGVPVWPGKVRRLGREIFRHPEQDLGGYLAGAFSLPGDLAHRWAERYKSDRAIQLAFGSLASPPVICRVNTLKTDVAGALRRLAEEGVSATPHENGLSIVLGSAAHLTEWETFKDGWIQPQDATATAVVAGLDLRPGMQVLDFCAAPGTKTTHIAERMCNQGRIVACDVSDEKLQKISDNCTRMGIDIVEPMLSQNIGGLDLGSFDVVLVDAPCSNSGVLARRPEIKLRFKGDTIGPLCRDQQFLLAAASQFVRPGGKLVYSTCSIEPDENTRVVNGVIKRCRNLRLRKEQLTLPAASPEPEQWHDGGFMAILGT